MDAEAVLRYLHRILVCDSNCAIVLFSECLLPCMPCIGPTCVISFCLVESGLGASHLSAEGHFGALSRDQGNYA